MKSRRYEKRKTKEHRGKHVGGPSRPDYTRGNKRGEVKSWSRPLSKYDVMKEAKKGRDEITSKSGYTKGAVEYAKRYRPSMKLFHKKKKVR
ncbi:MAG: hypothetical protein ACFFDN_30680 [Candidatus Hodarchaeota archaeon]